jgi:serine phosphatase RsbU (regulator of sigma subunit)
VKVRPRRLGATASLLAAGVLMLVAGPASARHPNALDLPGAKKVELDVRKKDGGATGPTSTSKSKGDDSGGSKGGGRGESQGKSKAQAVSQGQGKGKGSSRNGGGTPSGGSTSTTGPTGTGPVASTATTTTPVPPPAAVTTTVPTPVFTSPPSHAVAAPTGRDRGQQTSSRARRAGGARRGGAAPAAPPAATVGPLLAPAPAPRRRTAPIHPRASSTHRSNPLSSVGRSIPLPLPVPDWSKPVILALVALALLFAVRSQLASLRARRLERQRQQLLADVGLLQAALLPEIPERVGDLAASVGYRPADGPGAGGDFYDVFAFGDGRVAIIVGDVSGHGREALARATLMRYTLRAYAEAGLAPREALELAEHVLGTDGHGGSKVSGDFTTVAMAVYDGAAATLTYALAGHPPPVLIGAPLPEPEGAGYAPPIGWGMPTGQRQTTITLPEGAVACFFTDGLIEARAGGRPLGRERLEDELATTGVATSAGALLDRLVASADDTPDDMAACVVRVQRNPPRAPVRIEELVVAPSEVDGPAAERFLTACGVRGGDIALALHSTRRIAREFEGAVLYVRIDGAGASVKIAGVRSEPVDGRPLRVVEPASSLAS